MGDTAVGNGRYGDDEDISYMESETPVYGLSDAEDEADVGDFEEMPQEVSTMVRR